MIKSVGCQNEFDSIERILLKHPRQAFLGQSSIRKQWQSLGYSDCPDFGKALIEYETFVSLLTGHIPQIEFLPENEETGLDSLYVRDSSVMTAEGAILARMGKTDRSGEVVPVRDHFMNSNIPVLGEIEGDGLLEGGDVVVWDERTLIVGLGYRTNEDGIRQMRGLAGRGIEECVIVPLPHWDGPQGVMHLMSLISPVDRDLAVVFPRLLPVSFRKWLDERSVELVEVPDEEFSTLGCNVLTVAPRKCVILEGNPKTKRLLQEKGAEVWEYSGNEISLKGSGGPTCLTRPIHRKA